MKIAPIRSAGWHGHALTAAALLSLAALCAHADTLIPTHDAAGRGSTGTLDRTSTGNLYVGPIGTNDFARTFLTFDLSSQSAASGTTTLSFSVSGPASLSESNTSSIAQTFTLYALTSDWNGAANPGPTPGTVLATVSFTPSTGDDTQSLSFTSTALTTAFNNALGGTLHLGIKSDVEGTNIRSFKWMASREDAGYEPKLTFTPDNSLAIQGISVDASSNVQLLLSGAPGAPYRIYRSQDLQTPYYRKRWGERLVGTFPSGQSELSLSDPKGTNARGFYVATDTAPKARIMCVGDSITEGNTTMVVYKGPLYDKLTTAGYRFEYVGSKSSAYTSPSYGSLSLKHEGYSGKNCTEIAGFLTTNFPLHPADIVIIHSAHNLNVAEAVLTPTQEAAIVTTVENATRSMIQTARTTNPSVKILLAKVIPSGKLPKYSYIPAVNVRLGELAAELNTATQPVISVDQATGFDWTTDTITDMVHPNAAGGEKMAQKFFDALVPLLE